LSTWERIASEHLRALRLERVRTKILAFSVLATLIPSLATAWVAYTQSKRALTQTISTDLVGVSAQAANELGLWLKERQYDLRVFSNSYEVSQNLQRAPKSGPAGRARVATGRLGDYLNSVRERFVDYRELVVFGLDGQAVASSPARASLTALPRGWQAKLRAGEPISGVPTWDSAGKTMTVAIAVPIQPDGGTAIGAFAANLDLKAARAVLQRFARGHNGTAYLVNYTGDRILSSLPDQSGPTDGRLDGSAMRWLSAESHDVVEYVNPDGIAVISTLRSIPASNWSVVAELPQAEGYGQVNHLRNVTILVLAGLLAVVGLLAYALGLMLVKPLDRLTKGAERVAAGDFEVNLPVVTGGELGYLTKVFNDMVAKLRHSMKEVDAANETLRQKNVQLERLSLTDPLTGLFNRRHLMTMLESELRRAGRAQRGFSILMLDVDHFKTYNDAFGHQAGDDALIKVAGLLKASLRDVDCPARYGGEEFLVLLPDTGIEQATEVAERIRTSIRRESFTGAGVTLSVGVAEFPGHGASLDSLIAAADAALYHAKRQGRDRVVRADWADQSVNELVR